MIRKKRHEGSHSHLVLPNSFRSRQLACTVKHSCQYVTVRVTDHGFQLERRSGARLAREEGGTGGYQSTLISAFCGMTSCLDFLQPQIQKFCLNRKFSVGWNGCLIRNILFHRAKRKEGSKKKKKSVKPHFPQWNKYMKVFQLPFTVESSRPCSLSLQVAAWSVPPTPISLSGEDATQHVSGGGGDAINLRTNKN